MGLSDSTEEQNRTEIEILRAKNEKLKKEIRKLYIHLETTVDDFDKKWNGLRADNKILCENLTTREFQIISLCGIVGVDAEEHLESAVKGLIAKNRQLINNKFEFANEEQAEEVYWSAADEEIKILRTKNKQLEKAILDFGKNPAGFDWAVLDRIDKLEAENEDLYKEYQDLAKINLELNELLERWEHMIDPNTDPGGCANCFHQEWMAAQKGK